MKVTVFFLTAMAIFGLEPPAVAQSVVAPDAGVLGQRAVSVGSSLQRIQDYSGSAYSAGLGARFPVCPYLDVGIGYGQAWAALGIYSTFTEREVEEEVSGGGQYSSHGRD